MFGIGLSEIVLIALVGIIFIKPEDLPAALRKIGKAYGKVKKQVDELMAFKNAFMKQIDEIAKLEEKKPEDAKDAGTVKPGPADAGAVKAGPADAGATPADGGTPPGESTAP